MKKVLLLSESNRNGYSNKILSLINDKISSAELIKLKNYDIKFCTGCLWCDSNKACIIKDDLQIVIDKILESDLVVIAIPNYFGNMSGFFKNFIDRLHYMYKKEIIDNKKIIFIYTGADYKEITMEEMTQATYYVEKYLKLDVIKRFSFSSSEEIIEEDILEICDFINGCK